MKKVIIALTVCFFTSIALSSCTEETVAPKKPDTQSGSGSGSDGGRP
jgi:hypothetical protein